MEIRGYYQYMYTHHIFAALSANSERKEFIIIFEIFASSLDSWMFMRLLIVSDYRSLKIHLVVLVLHFTHSSDTIFSLTRLLF